MMPMFAELAASHLWAFALALLAMQLVAKEVGYHFGNIHKRKAHSGDDSIGIVSGSIYGLLAFTLAFNLSLAAGRHNERREAVLQEANAIGTLWLQLQALDHPRARAISELTEAYIALRKATVSADLGSPAIVAGTQRAGLLQKEMWGHLTALLQEKVDPQTAQLTASMNATFDQTTTMQFAMARSTPPEVLWLLFGMTVLAMAIMGYQFGLNGHPHRGLGLTVILVWTAVLLVILDLGAARTGDIRLNTSVYDSTMSSMQPITIPLP